MGTGFFLGVIGIITDLISVNRQLSEKINTKLYDLEEKIDKIRK